MTAATCLCLRIATLTFATAALSACGDDDVSGLGQPAPVTVTLQRTGGVLGTQAAAGPQAILAGNVDFEDVSSLTTTLTRIEFLPADEPDEAEGEGDGEGEGEGGGGWISLDVSDVPFDLIALPTTSQPGLVIATGTLPAGSYRKVRLFVSDTAVRFNTTIQIGAAFTFEPNVTYPVRIPSGEQSGIKTDIGFTVSAEGGVVGLVFDEEATLANITATGNGQVILAPVIHARTSSDGDPD
jgi:hypothetical protein